MECECKLLCVNINPKQNRSHSSSNSLSEAGCQHCGCAVQVMGFHLSLTQKSTEQNTSYDLTKYFSISGNKAVYSAAALNVLLDYCREIEHLQAKCYYGKFVLTNQRVICGAITVKS